MGKGTGIALRRGMAALLLAGAAAVTAGDRAAAAVYSIALPDITNKSLAASPTTVQAGGTVEIRNAVWNVGAGALTPQHGTDAEGPVIAIRFLLVRNLRDTSGIDAGSWGVDALKWHEIAWHTAVWEVPVTTLPGLYFLCSDVDPENAVREGNELNNRTCLPLTIKAAPEVAAKDTGELAPEPGDGPEAGTTDDDPEAGAADDGPEAGAADDGPEAGAADDDPEAGAADDDPEAGAADDDPEDGAVEEDGNGDSGDPGPSPAPDTPDAP